MASPKPLGPIEHVVLLMYENRSFDNILGGLYPERTADGTYDGVPPGWSNPEDPYVAGAPVVPAWQAATGAAASIIPYPRPLEIFDDIAEQLFHGTMKGFVYNYSKAASSPDGVRPRPRDVMQYYRPGPDGNIPVTSALAEAYAVSDRWFASGPVQTWANRLFVHCGTPGTYTKGDKTYAYLDNSDYLREAGGNPLHGALDLKSVFHLLDERGAAARSAVRRPAWKVYYHDFPIFAAVKYVYDRFHLFGGKQVARFDSELPWSTGFLRDVQEGALPTYSIIEPRYTKYTLIPGRYLPPSSNHPGGSSPWGTPPPISIHHGELLLKQVYQALAANRDLFAKTLLIVTYDEHGGLFDHVPPPRAVSPFEVEVENFDYSHYGVRVPALFINPHIRAGALVRPPGGAVFDHTTIISTLRLQFDLGAPLTPRDASAPPIEGLIDPKLPPNVLAELPDVHVR